MNLVTPIKIQGKKTKLKNLIKRQEIINNKVWIEPFLGSAEILFNVEPEYAYVSDNNAVIISFYKNIQEKKITSTIAREFLEYHGKKLLENGKEYYYEMRKQFNINQDPLYFLFLNRSCFNGIIRYNSKGEFNVPFCNKNDRFSKALITKICNQISKVEMVLEKHGKNWVFECVDWKIAVERYSTLDNAIFYFDPPYVNRHATYYDDWTEEKNNDFFNYLSNANINFILSNWYANKYRKNDVLISSFPSEKYEYKYIEHFYHVGGKLENRNKMVECLVIKNRQELNKSEKAEE